MNYNRDGDIKFKILDTVNYPEDIKKLNISELAGLSQDIRDFLIWNISQTGGHLGSNLGIVELTVAMHYIFDSPKDKIIWDVGHQSYVHKIITGRKDKFSGLRKKGGLSGFTKTSESEHDSFGAGHSSTALSAAIGIAQANILDKNNKNSADKTNNFYTIAVVGDGSFTGGLVYEALNNSKNCKNLIVILNDNEMSISKNVGTMSDYLANIRTTKKYFSFRNRVKNILSAIPLIGKLFVGFFQLITRMLRRSLYNATFFEQMGFDFLGPVDGHNIKNLLAVLNEAKTRKNPVFIHVKTQKGRGYKKAESSSVEYHSVGRFDIDEGIESESANLNGKEKIYSFALNFGNKICEAAEENKKICAITAAMAEGTELALFREKFPERFFDVGIAEGHAAVFSAGLAVGGYIPVYAVYSTFFQRAYDQILHDVALQNIHVVFCVDRAGLVGEDGATHHGMFDVAFLNHIPNITIFSPFSYQEFNESFDYAVNKINLPVVIRYPKGKENEEFNNKLLELNSENNLDYIYIKNNNAKYLIITYGRISKIAFEVYEKLNQIVGRDDPGAQQTPTACGRHPLSKGGEITDFIKLNKIKPVEYIFPEILKSDAENIILIEEGIEHGGVSEIIAAYLSKTNANKTVKIFAINNFVEQGEVGELFDMCGFDAEKICDKIMEDF
ncbi:MAG: 1-deoxy-D-xylulose-5-phosphate synthase [Oscillospiraceae bacterium]|nr:1-deoxy-D-xylulose-5-phosphate synthase [Oscillospiraceae bacterium]